jgi:tetratricopeptide (TPR) repeat protein
MGRWTRFAATGQFGYDRKRVKKQWPRLHAGDQEPLPQEPALLDAWALFHNGHFEACYRAGLLLGADGVTVANKAACIYATQLESREGERLALYQSIAQRAGEQTESEPDNPNAHYLLAYALGRYSQGISVAKALAQGMGSRIKVALETAIALQPLHAEAHFALGAFHAEIIDKVGALIGGMAYGAKKETSLAMFRQGFRLQPRSPVGLVEYALALLMLEGDARLDEATALYEQAAALQPADAREYLDITLARSGLDLS